MHNTRVLMHTNAHSTNTSGVRRRGHKHKHTHTHTRHTNLPITGSHCQTAEEPVNCNKAYAYMHTCHTCRLKFTEHKRAHDLRLRSHQKQKGDFKINAFLLRKGNDIISYWYGIRIGRIFSSALSPKTATKILELGESFSLFDKRCDENKITTLQVISKSTAAKAKITARRQQNQPLRIGLKLNKFVRIAFHRV